MTLRTRSPGGGRRLARRELRGGFIHDVRYEPVGGFAGQVPPEAPFGKFAGPARRRRQAAGGWAGEPDRQRQGSFADVDYGDAA